MNVRVLGVMKRQRVYRLLMCGSLLALLLSLLPLTSAQTDFTQGVTSLNSTQARIWFRPTTASTLVDVHYLVNGANQQNVRMINNAGTWEHTVSGLATGNVITYWFTYEKGGPHYNSAQFSYTHGGTAATATRTRTNTTGSGGGGNLALNKPATSSAACSTTETANKAVNGSVSGGNADKWCSSAASKWLQVDLTASSTIGSFTVRHAGAGGENTAYNTSAFNIQTSTDNVNWTTVVNVTGNTSSVTNHAITSRTARYVRLNVTTGAQSGQSNTARVYEFEVYSSSTPPTATRTRTNTTGTGPTATRTRTNTSGVVPTVSPGTFWGDTTNIPPANNVLTLKFLNRTNGRYPDSQVYWSFNGVTRSIAEAPTFDMPANSAGRMYFYLGSPTSQYTDFIEFTVGPDVFHGNTTRVDWFGIKLAMRIRGHNGTDLAVGEDYATFAEDRAVTFQKFINEVPAQFDHLATIKAPYMIPAPGKMGDTAFTPGGAQANYMQAYAQSVGVNASIFDILACAGSLANNPQMCAGLNRHVAHLSAADQRNPALFYQTGPANYYSKFWHDHSLQKLAYGFPYDDYAEQAAFFSVVDPQWLLVAIGW